MNKATIDLIKKYESLHDGDLTDIGLSPKMDPVGIWTEGYGEAMIDPRTKKFLKGSKNKDYANSIKTISNKEEAIIKLIKSYAIREKICESEMSIKYWSLMNENMSGALTSFVYNCGTGNPKYKIFENIKKYLDNIINKDQLIKYWCKSVIKSNGIVYNGLIKRREEEALLFFKF